MLSCLYQHFQANVQKYLAGILERVFLKECLPFVNIYQNVLDPSSTNIFHMHSLIMVEESDGMRYVKNNRVRTCLYEKV